MIAIKKIIISFFLFFIIASISVAIWFYWNIQRQGLDATFWNNYTKATVSFDANGIASIKSNNWVTLLRTQGYLVASERLWQMDLMRRKAAGRLSEWFGSETIDNDQRRYREDWQGVAKYAYQQLPAKQKHYLSAYVQGINLFIKNHPGQWGIEYWILGLTPKLWKAEDSLLIVLLMTEELSASAEKEAKQYQWRKQLLPDWEDFLFTNHHPWNTPLFGTVSDTTQLPAKAHWLPRKAIADTAISTPRAVQTGFAGSNSWAWVGENTAFLANDPHLGLNMPSLWYAQRFFIDKDNWLIGLTIPGIPGVIIGMNAYFAWTSTNTGEDVDDYLHEQLSEDLQFYRDQDEQGHTIWSKIVKKTFTIPVKGQAPVKGEAWFTHRGPLQQRALLNNDYYSRQWLPFKKGKLTMPTLEFLSMHNWFKFNQAIDAMQGLSQNLLFLDRQGNIGYRASGITIKRRVSGCYPQPAITGEWIDFIPSRAQRLIVKKVAKSSALSTANQRIWVDPYACGYDGDERADRLRSVLQQPSHNSLSMQQLQLDTYSRMKKIILQWVMQHASKEEYSGSINFTKWQQWDGKITSNTDIFQQADFLQQTLLQLLLQRVRSHLDHTPNVQYEWPLANAWLLKILTTPDGMQVFGLEDNTVADYLLQQLAMQPKTHYAWKNRWQVQHPFVTALPYHLGKYFALKEYPQVGAYRVVRVEAPKFGASVRVIWDLQHPEKSLWSLPIGQSGHVTSPHYKDLHKKWFAKAIEDKYIPVFSQYFQKLLYTD